MNIRLNPPPVIAVNTSRTFAVYGESFFNITSVYLSGYPYENLTFYNPFSAIRQLSSQNPGFYALKLNTLQYSIDENVLIVTLPPPTRFGFIDIILENEAGWGNLKQFVAHSTSNPYPPDHPLRDSWEPFIKPWENGIKVIPNYLL